MPHLCQSETKEFIIKFHMVLFCDFFFFNGIELIGNFTHAKVTKGEMIQMNWNRLIKLFLNACDLDMAAQRMRGRPDSFA